MFIELTIVTPENEYTKRLFNIDKIEQISETKSNKVCLHYHDGTWIVVQESYQQVKELLVGKPVPEDMPPIVVEETTEPEFEGIHTPKRNSRFDLSTINLFNIPTQK